MKVASFPRSHHCFLLKSQAGQANHFWGFLLNFIANHASQRLWTSAWITGVAPCSHPSHVHSAAAEGRQAGLECGFSLALRTHSLPGLLLLQHCLEG